MLQLAGNGLDVESAEENLKSHMEFFSTEDQFHSNLEELQGLVASLDPLIRPTGKEDLAQKMASLEEKSQRIIQDSHAQLDLLQRYYSCFSLYIPVKWISTWKIGIYQCALACKFIFLSSVIGHIDIRTLHRNVWFYVCLLAFVWLFQDVPLNGRIIRKQGKSLSNWWMMQKRNCLSFLYQRLLPVMKQKKNCQNTRLVFCCYFKCPFIVIVMGLCHLRFPETGQ